MDGRNYQVCSRCVMDTTDPEIEFDENGICSHCKKYDQLVDQSVFTGHVGRRKLEKMVQKIKADGKRKQYDCIIGVSGGVDSSFVAYKVKELGLRPLAVHLDNGWDSPLAVKNIENILSKLDIDLFTYVIDWEEFKDLQLSFLKASTPDSEIPSDHAIVSSMIHAGRERGIKHVISGCNIRTESHLPTSWSQGHSDWKYIKSVHAQFGNLPLCTFPHLTIWQYRKFATKMFFNILNFTDYNKSKAMMVLEKEVGWKYYGGKHYESIYTKFYQGYILPKKFGYDKRKIHFSSLICSGEMAREHALEKLKKEPYPFEMQQEDKAYVIKKLGLTDNAFENIMNLPRKSYWDYPSYGKFYQSTIFKTTRAFYRLYKHLT